MVIVCPTSEDGGPELAGLRAFRVRGGVGVTYKRGVWHAPMVVVRGEEGGEEGRGVTFVVVNAESGGEEDLEECEIAGGVGVRVETVGLWRGKL